MSEDKLKYYAQAMTIDEETGKPMPKVAIDGDMSLNIDPSNPLPVTGAVRLTGSIAEYGWAHNQPEPTPAESFAFGVRIESDGTMTSMYWNGSEWNEVA